MTDELHFHTSCVFCWFTNTPKLCFFSAVTYYLKLTPYTSITLRGCVDFIYTILLTLFGDHIFHMVTEKKISVTSWCLPKKVNFGPCNARSLQGLLVD